LGRHRSFYWSASGRPQKKSSLKPMGESSGDPRLQLTASGAAGKSGESISANEHFRLFVPSEISQDFAAGGALPSGKSRVL
jgi:hypothetical protein